MHTSFTSFIVDPGTKESLELEILTAQGQNVESGFLHNTGTKKKYPIVRGIPRFVEFDEGNYSGSFGYQWHKWPRVQFESENIGKPMEGHTRAMWERIVGCENHNLDLIGKTVVDIGCGPGRFIDVARSKGARVIGIDYSSAVEVAGVNFANDPDVCVVQADALNLPIRPESIDGAFTIGVLHHTPDPKRGVEEAYRILKSNGWFAIAVYGKGGYYDFTTVQLWRKLFKQLQPMFGYYPPLLYTYFTNYLFRPIALSIPPLGKAIRVFFPFVKLPDLDWSLLDTFDSVTPSYQSAHESYEVFNWLKNSGFQNIWPSEWGFTSFSSTK